ncbi:Lipopolysaccharide export system ATP-binding protein LptB [bacterium HR21]|nr:Lipopolysaccharide export system ATP-binding protein LptB [bacterium HR21]
MKSRLWCEGLVKIYRRRPVVRGVSLEVQQGDVVGLLGPNGAGKTTTFYMLVGMVAPNAGRIFLDSQELTRMPMYRRARLGISYLPQEPSVFRGLTVEENIRAVLQLRGLSRQDQRERLEELLEEFGIAHIRRRKGYMLSGGERRRCEIARALATEPRFILLDEPFAGIDPLAVEDLMRLVRRLKKRSIGVLITDHNVHETLSITDRAYILIDGTIFYAGTAEEIAAHPDVRRLYLGESFTLERYRWE